MKRLFQTLLILATLHVLSLALPAGIALPGLPPAFAQGIIAEPLEPHQMIAKGLGQDILVIYVQANDYPILDLENCTSVDPACNPEEDEKITEVEDWFAETSWGQCTVDITQQRDADGGWYVLPEGILDYATPRGIRSMEARDPTKATASDPTPPSSVTTQAVSDPDSKFDLEDEIPAGDYDYAVSAFHEVTGDVGVESKLKPVMGAITVKEGQSVELKITRAVADAERYIVYRKPSTGSEFYRIGYAPADNNSSTYVDTGEKLTALAHHADLLQAAMDAAAADLAADMRSFEDYEGIIAVIHSSFLRGQMWSATTFKVVDSSFKMATINISSETTFGRFAHEMGHWIGLADEYEPEPPHSGRNLWTTMDGSDSRQYMAWEKEFKLGWIQQETPSQNGHVKFLTRPAPGASDLDETFEILPTAMQEIDPNLYADVYTGIKIKIAGGMHYYIEGRDHLPGFVSDNEFSANDLVVVNQAFDAWVFDLFPGRNLADYPIAARLTTPGSAHQPDTATEVIFAGINPGPPKTYDVQVKLQALPQANPSITPWVRPPWGTVDIWVDSKRDGDGFDPNPETAPPKAGNGEAAWVNHVNRVFARISNSGQAEAKNVQVKFRVNTPGGIGNAGQFVDLDDPAPIDIPAGGWKNVYAEWTPAAVPEKHSCIQVEILPLVDESNVEDNKSQENIFDFYSGSNSPWEWVEIPVRVANPFDKPKRVDLEVSGLEQGWLVELEHKWVSLGPKEIKTVNAVIMPPPDEVKCKAVDVEIYGLIELGDATLPYGGLNAIVHLANPIEFKELSLSAPFLDLEDTAPPLWLTGTVISQTLPNEPIADKEIAVIITAADGSEQVLFTQTDADGGFDRKFIPPAGLFTVQAYYAGDECNAPTESDILTVGDLSDVPRWPFACIGEPITAQEVNTQFGYVYEPVSPFVVVPIGGPAGREINNIGYRTADDLLYGLELTLSGNQQVVVIDGFGTVFGLGRPAGLPADVRFDAGDLSPDGSTLYLGYLTELEQSLYSVDLSASPVLGAAVPIPLFGDTGTVHDLAYNRLDGKLYGGDSADGEIAVIGLGGSRTDYPVEGLPTGTAFGGAWFEGSGHLFLFENGGAIYEIDLGPLAAPAPEIVAVHTGPGAGRVDMALCHQDVLGVAKQMIAAPSGLPRPVTIDIFLENLSTGTDLSNLTAQESLSQIFGTPGVDWQLVSVTSIPLGFANPLYNGHTVTELVNQSPLQTLAAGTTARVTIELDLLTHAALRPDGYFCNQVLVFGQTAAGRWMGDLSTSGANTDPDNNGVPSEHELSCFAAKPRFPCDGEGRVTQGAGGQLDDVIVAATTFTLSPVGGAYGAEINNIGLRHSDRLLYGLELTDNGNAQVVQIDAAGTVWGLGRPAGLPADQRFDAGDVSLDGETMYINRHGQPLYKLSLADVPMLPAVTSVDIFGAPGHVFDWAAHPSDGLLYGGDSTDGQMATLDPDTGERIDRWVTGMPQGCPAYGAAWFNAAGHLMLYCNDGRLVEIDVNLRQVVGPVKTGTSAGNNDGASCVP